MNKDKYINEMEDYLYNHNYISQNNNNIKQQELSLERASCIVQKYRTLTEEKDKEIEQLKKQKDDVVEYIKEIKKHREEGLNITEYKAKWRSMFDYLESDEIIDKVLRMLGEIDVKD